MSLFNPNHPLIDVRSWYRAATEKRELLAMDDRMLRDVGLTRVDAVRIANQRSPRVTRFEPRGPSHPGPIDPKLVDAHIARAHRLREDTIRTAFATLFRWLKPQLQPKARLRKLAPVAR
jgi:uncharacterized protein YjiS (DUF1127 family)